MGSDRAHNDGDDLFDAVVQLSFTVIASLSQLAASVDLSLTQVRLIGILRGREPRMAQLADRLGLDRSTVSGLVDRAAARGLLERFPDDRDRRASRVRLTAAGHALAADVTARATAELAPMLERLSTLERHDLARRLRALLD